MQKRVTFNSKDGYRLSGVLHVPSDGTIRAYAVFAHCFTCTKNINAAKNITNALSDHGIGVLRFDFTGLGSSKGEFANTSFTSNVNDLISAAKFLKEEYGTPQLLVGHSLGGTAVLAAAAHLEDVVAVATIGAPAGPDHILRVLENDLEALEQGQQVSVNLGGFDYGFKQCFVDDAKSYHVEIERLKKAILVLHSPQDIVVSVDQASKIFATARHPKSFISLDGADHLLGKDTDSVYVGELISYWVNKYIAASP